MAVRMLGPVELLDDAGRVVEIGAPKRRAVLAILASELDRVVSVDRLLDQVWDADPPPRARTALQGHVSALRKVLGPGLRLETRDPGYVLRGDPDMVDAHRFDLLTARAAAEDDLAATDTLRQALGLWRGSALADLAGMAFREPLAARFDDARRGALEARADRLLRLGRGAEAIADLTAEVSRNPLRESLARALVLCLYQDGRQAEAMQVYHDTRAQLAEELGVIPGAALQAAYQAVLRGEPLPSADERTDEQPGPGWTAGAAPDPGPPEPAAASEPAMPAQLPREVAGFAGRRQELGWLDEYGPGHGLLLVVGASGVGKTALALHWAHRVADQFPDGQLFVDLRGYDGSAPAEPEAAVSGFLRCLGVAAAAIPPAFDDQVALYRTLLSGKRVLVVIDNARTADTIRPLLPGSRGATVVITSRHRLDGFVAQEGARVIALAPLGTDEALDLLGGVLGPERVAAEPAAARHLVELCDELPLALRIAAARLVTNPTWSLAELAGDLADERHRLTVLSSDDGTISVAAALTLTYQTLPEPAAELFRYLGLHPGPHLDVPAAAALTGGAPAETGRLLTTLAGAHLIEETARGRYGRHDLVRLYSRSLAAEGFDGPTRELAVGRLLDYYLHATAAVYHLLGTITEPHPPLRYVPAGFVAPATSASALDWFDANEATLRAVLHLGTECGHHEQVWKIVDNVSVPYSRRGNHRDLTTAVAIGRRAARAAGDEYGEMRMLRRLGSTLADLGRAEEATVRLRQALELADRFGDDQQRCAILDRLAACGRASGRWGDALAFYRDALAISRKLGDPRREAIVLNNIGDGWIGEGDPDRGLGYIQQALDRYADLPPDSVYVAALHSRGSALERLGQLPAALDAHEQALTVAQRLGDLRAETPCLDSLGGILVRLGRTAEAKMHLRRAVELYTQLGRPEAAAVRDRLRRLDLPEPAAAPVPATNLRG